MESASRHATEPLRLFGLRLARGTLSQAADKIIDGINQGSTRRYAFVNAHTCNVMWERRSYQAALASADGLFPDGSGMRMAARMQGMRLENLNGTDLFPVLCRAARDAGKSIYLLGAREGVAEAVARNAQDMAPGLRIVGAEHGYFTSEGEAAVLQRVNDAAPDIVLVALGVPRQDEWLAKHMHQLNVGAAMGVGGLFDFYSGRIPRAPLWLRKLGLEWMFRLHQEPARLMRRYLIGNITFTLWAAMEALRCVWWARAKRMIDLTLAFAGLLILAPLFAIIALAIRLDSKGPIFFRQTRVGQNGKPFRMLKFRSMHIDAEQRRASLLASNERGSKTSFKMQNDPRITRVGRLLRRASLDELPQLLNIFQGSMSLVGPRPALPREVSYYESRALKRLNGKPGLTCTWQVSGRALIDFREQVEMDITYLERQGPLTDLLILLRTIPAVVSGRGAM